MFYISYALWLFVDAKGGEKIGIKSRAHISEA